MPFRGSATRQIWICGANAALQREIGPLATEVDWARRNFLKQ
jgi:hypothetical protein